MSHSRAGGGLASRHRAPRAPAEGGVTIPEITTFYLFATAVSAGVPVFLPLVPLRAFGRRFFVLMSLVSVVFVGLATIDLRLDVDLFHFAAAGLLIAYNVLLPRQPGVDPTVAEGRTDSEPSRVIEASALVCLIGACICGLVGTARDAVSVHSSELSADVPVALSVAQAVTSALLLGSAIVAMVLGHWYLVSAKLSFAPLRYLTVALGLALVARAAVVALCVWVQWPVWEELVAQSGWTRLLLSEGVFLTPRFLFGLIVPLVLVRLVWNCVRIESNQSATGILYVIVAFVLIGEILSKYFLVAERALLV